MFDATRAESADPARQAPRTRPVLRIFISSTAIDLTGYRDKVRDAVLRLENLPIAMETFSALGGAPARECMRMAAETEWSRGVPRRPRACPTVIMKIHE